MSLAKMQRAFAVYLKIIRLSTFIAIVGCVGTLLAARSVYGSATKSVVELNREWSRQVGKLERGEYRIRFNGQSMMTSSHMTDASVHDVLATADEECRAHSGGLDGDVAKLPQLAIVKLTSFVFGTVHQEWSNRGYVACLERDGKAGVAGMADSLREAMQTGVIAKLGKFRYVIVDRGPGATKTHVLEQWTEGEFNLSRLFPAEGDVEGSDLPEVARPEGGRRILDASVEGATIGVRVYEAPGAPAEILAKYDRDLGGKGWKNVELSPKDGLTMRVFDQGPADLFITASQSRDGAGSVVSIADVPPR